MSQTTAGFIIIAALLIYAAWHLWRYQITAVGMTLKVDTPDGKVLARVVGIEWDRNEKDWLLTLQTEQGTEITAWRFECVAVLR